MYLLSFVIISYLLQRRLRKIGSDWPDDVAGNLMFYSALGVLLGGRIGYMLIYQNATLLADPLKLFALTEGGMSAHGGIAGGLLAIWLYSHFSKRDLFSLLDQLTIFVPIGLGLGRLGNFINGELWGRVTDVPWSISYWSCWRYPISDPTDLSAQALHWAQVFEQTGAVPRHPSQLYQVFFEGIVLYIILYLFAQKPRPRMAITGMGLTLYGVFRFNLEWFRQPDSHIGFIAFDWLTTGQLMSIPVACLGLFLLFCAYRPALTPHKKSP